MLSELMEDKRKKTKLKLDGIRNLPSIPKVIIEVSELLRKDNTTAVALAQCIGKDQGLTTKILSISNSPLYGLQRQVSSLEFAIVVLGLKEISQLVTSISISGVLKQSSNEHFKFEELWNHSLLVGTGAKDICRQLGYPELGADAFVGGMLHDMGIQLLIKYFSVEFKSIVNASLASENFLNQELEELGLTHQDMGAYLATKWNLPDSLCSSIQYHHNPNKATSDNILVSIIHLTDYMSQLFNVAPFFGDGGFELDESIIDTLNFSSREELNEFIENYKEQFIDAEQYIETL
jgi:HD-like signal output (HDOD) protein